MRCDAWRVSHCDVTRIVNTGNEFFAVVIDENIFSRLSFSLVKEALIP